MGAEEAGKTRLDLRFWGAVVKPGETAKYDPGELCYHLSQVALEAEDEDEAEDEAKHDVEVFVRTADKKIMLGTLSVDCDSHFAPHFVLTKKFELLHSSRTSNVCFTGYTFKIMDRPEITYNTSTKAKAPVEETTSPGQTKGDDKLQDRIDAQNPSDGNASESSVDVDYPQKKTKGKRTPLETPLKTPQGKKAKMETTAMGNKTAVHDLKTSDHVHVATPHPAKRARKAPESKDMSKQRTSYTCNSCSRSFSSPMGLKDHSRAKHDRAE